MHDILSTTYNGWSNRETWLASLWLNNDPYSQALLREAYKRGGNACSQADWLKSRLELQLEEEAGPASLWCDLLNTAFAQIDWIEVIESNES